MRRTPASLVLSALVLAGAAGAARAAGTAGTAAPPAYPPTRVEVVRDTLHGDVIGDPYRWLEDRDSPETRQWVRAQMAYTEKALGRVPGRDAVAAALARYTRTDTRTQPREHGGRLFFLARRADQQQPVLVMRTSPGGPDVVLVDPNPMSADHTTSVALLDVSNDGRLVAYGIRKGGQDEVEVHLLDTDTRREVPGGLPKARYFGFSIDAAKQGAWYGRWEPKGSRVYYHRFGDDPGNAKLVFGDGIGPAEIPVPVLSDNGRWLAVQVLVGSSGDQTRLYLRDTAGDGPFALISDTLRAYVSPRFAGDTLVIETNWNAPNHRILEADARHPDLANWKEVVPERPDAVIDDVRPVAGRLAVGYLRDVSSELAVFGLDGRRQGSIPLPGLGTSSTPAGEWTGHDAYYTFSSFNRPPTIFRHDFASGKSAEWWRSSVPFPSGKYEVRQEWAVSKDGTKVPMFVTRRAGLKLDGSNPVLMTGYGGFNVSEKPRWSAFAAAWLDLGGTYVLTNLRGGSEFGESWHRAGMLGNKQHVFDDFIACAEWLESHGYCTPAKLAITGGSNGGLLVGAVMTQRPQLFGAVLCQVPLLDMLRYQRFLVARFWVPEYGSAEDADQYRWLKGYSPYQHVERGVKYPPVMFVSGDSDTRVDPLHARKMAARMQALDGPNPVLLHYDVSQGHSGGKSVDQTIADGADNLQFLRWQLGMVRVP